MPKWRNFAKSGHAKEQSVTNRIKNRRKCCFRVNPIGWGSVGRGLLPILYVHGSNPFVAILKVFLFLFNWISVAGRDGGKRNDQSSLNQKLLGRSTGTKKDTKLTVGSRRERKQYLGYTSQSIVGKYSHFWTRINSLPSSVSVIV